MILNLIELVKDKFDVNELITHDYIKLEDCVESLYKLYFGFSGKFYMNKKVSRISLIYLENYIPQTCSKVFKFLISML